MDDIPFDWDWFNKAQDEHEWHHFGEYGTAAETAWNEAVSRATAAEREACAVLVRDWPEKWQYEDAGRVGHAGDIDAVADGIKGRDKETGDDPPAPG